MKKVFGGIAVMLAIIWGILFFIYQAGPMVHFLWVLVLVSIMFRTAYGRDKRDAVGLKR